MVDAWGARGLRTLPQDGVCFIGCRARLRHQRPLCLSDDVTCFKHSLQARHDLLEGQLTPASLATVAACAANRNASCCWPNVEVLVLRAYGLSVPTGPFDVTRGVDRMLRNAGSLTWG